jgi:hypothetical protein
VRSRALRRRAPRRDRGRSARAWPSASTRASGGRSTAPRATAIVGHARAHPKGEHGEHAYRLEDYGLTRDDVERRFADYCERFAPRAEGRAMSDEAVAKVVDGRAWAEFCELLRKAGEVIQREDLGTTPFDRAEGLRYLSRLLVAGFSSFVEATGPAHRCSGRFRTGEDGARQPDNYYVSASIDPRRD